MTNFQGLSLSTTTPTVTKATNAVYWKITLESIFTAQQAALHIYKTHPNSAVFFN